MENFKTLLKIIMPPIACLFLLYTIGVGLFGFPLIFALVISIANWNYYKHNPFVGTLVSLLSIYLIFFIGFFGTSIWQDLFRFIKFDVLNLKDGIAYVFSTFILTPLLVFFCYRYFFNFKKGKFTMLIIIISVATLILIGFLSINELKTNIINRYSLWQVIMALALQLIIYQKSLVKNSSNKKIEEK